MENGAPKWHFEAKKDLSTTSPTTIRTVLSSLMKNLNKEDNRAVIPLGNGDPSYFPSFSASSSAVEAIIHSVTSGKFDCYSPSVGLLPARRAVANYLNNDLPYKLSADDVFITLGCKQAITIALTVLGQPGTNILVPRPGYPHYEAFATYNHLQIRYFDLLPDQGWEVDLDAVQSLTDENTVAMVIINPGNPCGNVYSYQHLKKIAETARKLGIMMIADEVYAHLAFGSTPFVPMGVFGSIVPVLSLGSISKRWVVPGWRIGWLVVCDPNGVLQNSGIINSIVNYLHISSDAATIIQGALPQILENTDKNFFLKINKILRETADMCCDRIENISCITCPKRPEGAMFVMAKLNLSLLEDIKDDMEFCLKLAKEESVIVLPGVCVGMKNWVRITFATEPSTLETGIERMKSFCQRHAKKP